MDIHIVLAPGRAADHEQPPTRHVAQRMAVTRRRHVPVAGQGAPLPRGNVEGVERGAQPLAPWVPGPAEHDEAVGVAAEQRQGVAGSLGRPDRGEQLPLAGGEVEAPHLAKEAVLRGDGGEGGGGGLLVARIVPAEAVEIGVVHGDAVAGAR